jgi:dTDP-3-amino-2,3,6-trideoxy-4-keto-D-glucose/dTDP-3-amino-3,4,6-trideoxy-alpha-D-glucose/dTDP-2,6-dideoxy-D-kanosamine transaminase
MKFFSYNPSTPVSEKVFTEIQRVINSGQFIGGLDVLKFEEAFGDYTGSSEVATCGNGLDALMLCINDLDLPEKSKIAVSGHTFFASWLAVLNSGHMPVGVDTNLGNLQMSTLALEETIRKEEIKAVVYVHMHGIMGDIQLIADICKSFSIPLIEDCAQAHGLRLETKHAGTFGDYGAFSFYPTKNLPALGDGGAVISLRKKLDSVRTRSNYGWFPGDRDVNRVNGINSRLDTIQAVILKVHLENLDAFNLRRTQIAEKYSEVLQKSIHIDCLSKETQNVWHHFPIRLNKRDLFRKYLSARNIPTQIHYPIPCHLQPAYLNTLTPNSKMNHLPNTELISKTIVSLPLHPWLTDDEVELVTLGLKEWIQLNG